MQSPAFKRLGAMAASLAAVVAVGWGCGGGGAPPVSGSSTEASVSGRVLVRGKPARGGTVFFNPSNVRRKTAQIRSTDVNPDGTYEVTTLIGENIVSFGGKELAEFAYHTAYLDIEEGSNTIDIELPVPESAEE